MGKLSRLRLKPKSEKKWQQEGVTPREMALLKGKSIEEVEKKRKSPLKNLNRNAIEQFTVNIQVILLVPISPLIKCVCS